MIGNASSSLARRIALTTAMMLAAWSGASAHASAAPILYTFSGVVTGSAGQGRDLAGIRPGDPFAGVFSYDPASLLLVAPETYATSSVYAIAFPTYVVYSDSSQCGPGGPLCGLRFWYISTSDTSPVTQMHFYDEVPASSPSEFLTELDHVEFSLIFEPGSFTEVPPLVLDPGRFSRGHGDLYFNAGTGEDGGAVFRILSFRRVGVPEPTTLLLTGIGLLLTGLAVGRSRRRLE